MMKNVLVRNSTAEFLTFIAEGKEEGIQVLYKNESIWATQKAMSMLFDCSSDNIGLHLKNIFKEHEKNKLLQIKRRFSRIDLFLKKECAGGT